MSADPVRIGTRSSPLALWQARWVARLIESQGRATTLVKINSTGDQDGTQPLYAMNIQGIFTKALDQALLNKSIDIAVHSYKDVPTQLPQGIELAAVLERGAVADILVYKKLPKQWPEAAVVGTSSLRRSAQWKNRYPKHQTENLRGNVQKRMQTLSKKNWVGALFAQAGLERVDLCPHNHLVLDWMIPAPAQGAVCIVIDADHTQLKSQLAKIGCTATQLATEQERLFMRLLEGGCTAPIGAWAKPINNGWRFKAGVFSLDGTQKCTFDQTFSKEESKYMGEIAAETVLKSGGAELMKSFRN